MKNRVLGVIGGLGPLATTRFMELVIGMTEAKTDQENVDMIVYNFPSIPDRTGYILGSNLKSPLPGLRSVAGELTRQKVDLIAIPCVTAHYFHSELQSTTPVPILNGLTLSANLLKKRGIRRAGIMATDGTLASGILSRELEKAGILPVLPSSRGQEDVMHIIYENVKAGKPVETDRFLRAQRELQDAGAEAVVLGCTELSVAKSELGLGTGLLDIMEVMARESVLRCGKKLKANWKRPDWGGIVNDTQHIGISGSDRKACAG